MRTAHRHIATSLLFKQLQQRLVNVAKFRFSKLLYSHSLPFKHTNYFGCRLPNHLDRRIYKTEFPTHVRFLFAIFCSSHYSNFSFDTQHFFFVTLSMLLHYQSSVKCRNRNVEDNIMNTVNYFAILSS